MTVCMCCVRVSWSIYMPLYSCSSSSARTFRRVRDKLAEWILCPGFVGGFGWFLLGRAPLGCCLPPGCDLLECLLWPGARSRDVTHGAVAVLLWYLTRQALVMLCSAAVAV